MLLGKAGFLLEKTAMPKPRLSYQEAVNRAFEYIRNNPGTPFNKAMEIVHGQARSAGGKASGKARREAKRYWALYDDMKDTILHADAVKNEKRLRGGMKD